MSSLNLDSVRAAECEGVEEQLRDEAVVAGRGFAVRAVRQDLLVQLAQGLAQPERAPLTSRAQLRQADAEPQKAHNVREVMITRRDVGELKVASDVMSVRVEEREETCEPTLVERARTSQQLKGREQVQRAQRDFHRAGPVRPEPDGILRAPAFELLEKFFGEALFARERVGASEREHVAEPVQLP